MIGLFYLLSLDVSLGVWFAFLSSCIGRRALLGWSIGPGQPYSMPATPRPHGPRCHVFLGIRQHMVGALSSIAVVRSAVGRGRPLDDSGEILSYRTAVFGFLAASVFAVVWLSQTGLGYGSALFYYLLCIVTFIGLARIVSQAGLAYGVSPVAPPVFTVTALGPGALGPSGLTALGMNFPWSADLRTFVMASAATGLKIAEVTRLESRRL